MLGPSRVEVPVLLHFRAKLNNNLLNVKRSQVLWGNKNRAMHGTNVHQQGLFIMVSLTLFSIVGRPDSLTCLIIILFLLSKLWACKAQFWQSLSWSMGPYCVHQFSWTFSHFHIFFILKMAYFHFSALYVKNYIIVIRPKHLIKSPLNGRAGRFRGIFLQFRAHFLPFHIPDRISFICLLGPC